VRSVLRLWKEGRSLVESGFDMSEITLSMTGGGSMGVESEEQKRPIPKRRQTGGDGGGGADIWGVTL